MKIDDKVTKKTSMCAKEMLFMQRIQTETKEIRKQKKKL